MQQYLLVTFENEGTLSERTTVYYDDRGCDDGAWFSVSNVTCSATTRRRGQGL